MPNDETAQNIGANKQQGLPNRKEVRMGVRMEVLL